MSKILKKISAAFLLILMLFSVSFNVLDYGYKVYATDDDAEIYDIQFNSNVENADYYDPTVEKEARIWFRCKNVTVKKEGISCNPAEIEKFQFYGQEQDGNVNCIFLQYDEKILKYCELNNITQMTYTIEYQKNDGGGRDFVQVNIPIKYNIEKGNISDISLSQGANKIISNNEVTGIDYSLGTKCTLTFDYTGSDDLTVTLAGYESTQTFKQDTYYVYTLTKMYEDLQQDSIELIIRDSNNSILYQKDIPLLKLKLEIEFENNDNILETKVENDSITMNIKITNYIKDVKPDIISNNLECTLSPTEKITGSTKTFSCEIKLKDGQTYNETENITISYNRTTEVSATIKILQASSEPDIILEYQGNTPDIEGKHYYNINSEKKEVILKIEFINRKGYNASYSTALFNKKNELIASGEKCWANNEKVVIQEGIKYQIKITFKEDILKETEKIEIKANIYDDNNNIITTKKLEVYVISLEDTELQTEHFVLKLTPEIQSQYKQEQWLSWMNRWEKYYEDLSKLTGYYPNKITVDCTNESLATSANGLTEASGLTDIGKAEIKLAYKYLNNALNKIMNEKYEYSEFIHELGHVFQYQNPDWQFQTEVTTILEEAVIMGNSTLVMGNGKFGSVTDIFEDYMENLPESNNYKLYHEIAYKILTETSVDAVRRGISENPGKNVSTDLDRFEKFAATVKEASGGKDIGEIKLSNGQTIREYMGGKNPSGFYYKIGVSKEEPIPENKKITVHVGDSIILCAMNQNTSGTVIKVSNLDLVGEFENGKTIYTGFHFTATGTAKATFGDTDTVIAEFIIEEAEAKDTIYVFNVNGSGKGKQEGEGAIVQTDRDNPEKILGGENNWLITEEGGREFYCFQHGKTLRFESGKYFYRYEKAEEISIDKKHQLVLAFIKYVSDKEASEIAGVQLPKDWKRHLTQFYIWNNLSGDQANYGDFQTFIDKITTGTNGKNKYIDFEKETVKIDGKTYKIKENSFKANKYIVNAKYYASTGKAKWANQEDEDMQPLITFEIELEEVDTPKIQLRKVDKTDPEKKLEATFEVFVKNDKGTYVPVEKNPVITSSTEEDIKIEDISLEEKAEYLIVEKVAPEGYEITKQYIILNVDPDANPPVNIRVFKANNINTDGSAKPTTADQQVSEESLWSIEEKEIITEKDGNIKTYVIVVKNDKGTPQLKLKKVDKKGEPIELLGKKGSFTITISGAISYTITKELDDNAEIIIPEKELEGLKVGDTITVKITENTPPDGYKKWEKDSYEFTATYLEDKNWKIENNNDKNEFNVTLQGAMLVMELKNEKDLPEIEITKVDEEGNAIEDTIVFTVYEDQECTKSVGTITIRGGKAEKLQLDNIGKNTTKTYYVKETTTPMGYKELNYIIALEITVDQTGKISKVSPSIIKTGEGEIKYPPTYTTEENTIKLNIKNEQIEIKKINLELLKVDADTNEPLSGARFNINGTGYNASGGEIGPIDLGEIVPGSTISVKIEETSQPAGYVKLEEPITVELPIEASGKIGKPTIASGKTSAKVTAVVSGETLTIKVTVRNVKEKPDAMMPLLMYLKGDVWLDNIQGKESEINGELDGGDKKLEGIIVTLYESDGKTALIADKAVLQKAIEKAQEKKYEIPDSIKQHIEKIQENGNVTVTDSSGHFEFYGLDPDKTYTVKFTYNGMRYSEVKVSTTTGISGFGKETEKSSRAIENKNERNALTERFQVIGTYPYNYYSPSKGNWNKTFTQTEVEKEIKNHKGNYLEFYGNANYDNVIDNVADKDLAYFIKDTKITATASGFGGILSDAEDIIKAKNDALEDNVDVKFVYPVVDIDSKTFDNWSLAQTSYNEIDSIKDDSIFGGALLRYIKVKTFADKGEHPDHDLQQVDDDEKLKYVDYKEYKEKGDSITKEIELHNSSCPIVTGYDEKGRPNICGATTLRQKFYDPEDKQGSATVYKFSVVEGYKTKLESGIRFAIFDESREPYYASVAPPEEYKRSQDYIDLDNACKIDTSKTFGWKAKGRDIQTIYNELADNIDKLNQDKIDDFKDLKLDDKPLGLEERYPQYLEHVNIGVAYRPTMDLGLYDDVVESYVNINGKEETYKYDKRETNGGDFKFGVNKYDINSGSNESDYISYYDGLSNGNPDGGENGIKDIDYTNYLRKEDIVLNTSNTKTENGKADAGNYPDYPVEITVTYKIKIVNQSGVKAAATEIVDYYSSDFKVNGVYKNEEKTQKLEYNENSIYSNRGPKASASGFNTIYIPLGTWLENNQSEYIYIELGMINPKSTLGGNVLDSGYKTLNYSEINGYRTEIGVLDIDSVPGDLVEDGRLENGAYDDDESKSPTLIFKNPSDASRTIKGTVFEDLTHKEEIKAYTKEERDGNGILDGNEPKLVGINVQLVEVDNNGYEVKNSSESGLRAETLTDDQGNYEFTKIVAGNYMIKFEYGNNEKTVLIKDYNGGSNSKSYNGQDYENTLSLGNYGSKYWYTVNKDKQYSDAVDLNDRRIEVMKYSQTLTNHIAEVFNSWKDKDEDKVKNPDKEFVNKELVMELINNTQMQAETKPMTLEVEFVENREEIRKHAGEDNETYFKYIIEKIDFGIVERERAELQITKKVSYISIVDSTGKEITGGTEQDMKEGKIKYIKMIPNDDKNKKQGFVDMEIDSELLSGATLHVTYEITVTNTSEAGNTISNIEVIDYVSNNLNFDKTKNSEWTPVTTKFLEDNINGEEKLGSYINKASLTSSDISNKIDLTTYQTILMTTFNGAGTKTLTLEKNLSSEEDSNFNYENQVEIVSSYNPNGRGDYSSIYGNLDPTTYTSRQGNLKWENDYIETENQHGFPQMRTVTELDEEVTNPNAIRLAEKDSGNAEEVIITPPTGAKGIVFETYHYVLALIGLLSLAGTVILIKKYISLTKE